MRSHKGAGRCVIANFAILQTRNLFLFTEKQECRQSEPNHRGSGLQFYSHCWCCRQIIKEMQLESSVFPSPGQGTMTFTVPFYRLLIKTLWWENIPQNSHGSLCVLALLHKVVKRCPSSATFPLLEPKSQLGGWEHVWGVVPGNCVCCPCLLWEQVLT